MLGRALAQTFILRKFNLNLNYYTYEKPKHRKTS